MKYNLQYGRIIDIGSHARSVFPDASIGDTIVFKHIVESQEWRIIDVSENILKILVDVRSGTEVHAILKSDGTWIINPVYIFLAPDTSLLKLNKETKILQAENPELFRQENYIMDKLDQLKADQDNLKQTAECSTDIERFEDTYGAMQRIADEQQRLGAELHGTKFCLATVTHINPETERKIGVSAGSKILLDDRIIYDLNLQSLGFNFKMCLTELVVGCMS